MKYSVLSLVSVLTLAEVPPGLAATTPENIVATFSIVARDPGTGAIGCAVQSRYFAVGAVVCWGEADVGIIATQANVNVGYGPSGMALLRQGLTAREVLEKLQTEDAFPGKDGRQVAIIDAKGNLAVYTGPAANEWAGHRKGATFSTQGNILASAEVVESMAAAFEKSTLSFPERLVAALEAGQLAGGDRRGMQSASMLVVQKGAGRNINHDIPYRLHVDDSREPIAELKRLLHVQLAMSAMQSSRQLFRDKKTDAALAEARRAVELWPNTSDTHMTLGLLLYSAGDKDGALTELKRPRRSIPSSRGSSSPRSGSRGRPDSTRSFSRSFSLTLEKRRRYSSEIGSTRKRFPSILRIAHARGSRKRFLPALPGLMKSAPSRSSWCGTWEWP